jgi:hypothetical protein
MPPHDGFSHASTMRAASLDEGSLERMVAYLAHRAGQTPERFTPWERNFVATMCDVIENWHLTDRQCGKLVELFARHVGGGGRGE